jgi:hypothetical protein
MLHVFFIKMFIVGHGIHISIIDAAYLTRSRRNKDPPWHWPQHSSAACVCCEKDLGRSRPHFVTILTLSPFSSTAYFRSFSGYLDCDTGKCVDPLSNNLHCGVSCASIPYWVFGMEYNYQRYLSQKR